MPLLLVLDGAHENDDPTVWSRIGWSAGLPGTSACGCLRTIDFGVTAARWGEALHWLNDWSDVVLETPSERSAAALPGDVDADTVCVLSAASGPISGAELVQFVEAIRPTHECLPRCGSSSHGSVTQPMAPRSCIEVPGKISLCA